VKLLRQVAVALIVLAAIGAAAFWFLTQPERLTAQQVAALGPGDAGRGERIFRVGGCVSCHARPKSQGEARLELAGGLELVTPFGTFVAPNISPDPSDGIGAWSVEDFANAMLNGVAPDGSHLYPAFPYPSYARMKPADVADLYAYMKTLPPVSGKAAAHRLAFPFNVRRGLGLWKILYLSHDPVVALAADAPAEAHQGQYLVEGPGHCGECHTPRDLFGGAAIDQWLAGAVAAEGRGIIPNITPGPGGIGDWSAEQIASFLKDGFKPDFDTVGGSMVEVQQNLALLADEDRAAIAAYLKAVPPRNNGFPAKPAQASN
jgi:mono/diheme cytochrome c family protein